MSQIKPLQMYVVTHRFREGIFLGPSRLYRDAPHFYSTFSQAQGSIDILADLAKPDWIVKIVSITDSGTAQNPRKPRYTTEVEA